MKDATSLPIQGFWRSLEVQVDALGACNATKNGSSTSYLGID